MFTLSECFDDKGEVEEANEQHVEFLETGGGSVEAFEPTEQPFDLVAFLVEGSVIHSGSVRLDLGGNTGTKHRSSTSWRVSTLIGSIHQQGEAVRHPRQLPQQFAAFGRIVRVAG